MTTVTSDAAPHTDSVDCFQLSATSGSARAGIIHTAHGIVRTPVFMPVGTKATVKATSVPELLELSAQIILGNTYHLVQRPGTQAIREAGGLHEFMHWPRPILTDSGGYQVFSLRDTLQLDDAGATFQSVYDGSAITYTPESVVEAQTDLGSDIAMVLDECPPGDAPRDAVVRAVERTTAWARRAREHHLLHRRSGADPWSRTGMPQLQFGIVQGGIHPDLREQSVSELLDIGFDGYAVGGLSVGESAELTMPALESATALLPTGRPRYYMGIGDPVGVLDVIHRGVDMFDCVLPTRLGRTAAAMVPVECSPTARLNMRNARHAQDDGPILDGCGCFACISGYSRRYIRHLFQQQEVLGLRLLTLHNLHVLISLVARARRAICSDTWDQFYAHERARWSPIGTSA